MKERIEKDMALFNIESLVIIRDLDRDLLLLMNADAGDFTFLNMIVSLRRSLVN